MAGLERKIRKNRNIVDYYISKNKCPNCKAKDLKPFDNNTRFICTNCESEYHKTEMGWDK